MRKARQIFIERHRTTFRRCVQHLKQPRHPGAEIGPVGSRALLDELQEDVARFEDSSVVGEEAEHDPDQEQLQVMAVIAGSLERIVQARDQLRRLDVDRILIAERAPLHTDDESKFLNVPRQVGEGEMGFLTFVAVKQLERLKIAEQLVPRAVPLGESIEVRAGLTARDGQVAPGALLLDQ